MFKAGRKDFQLLRHKGRIKNVSKEYIPTPLLLPQAIVQPTDINHRHFEQLEFMYENALLSVANMTGT